MTSPVVMAGPATVRPRRRLKWRIMFSTMTTAPSTTIPKSRAPSEEISGNVAQIEPDRCKEQRERNGQRDDERGTGIEEKQEENDADQDHAFRQIVHHRVQGEMKEIAAIQHGDNLHTWGQDPVVELIHLLVNCLERCLLFGALAHQHDALDDIRLIDDAPVLHVVGASHMAQTDLRTLAYFRYVLYAEGGSGLRL